MTASLSHPRSSQRSLHALPTQAPAQPRLRLVAQPEGLLQVHTAPFRGSVASVLAQALRSAGLGSRVVIAQFLKGGVEQTLERAPSLCGRLRWLRPAMEHCVDAPINGSNEARSDHERSIAAAIGELWAHCRDQLLSGTSDLMVFDELGLAVSYGYLDLDEVVAVLQQRPAQMDVILTGPSMPDPLMAMADQVTQLRRGV